MKAFLYASAATLAVAGILGTAAVGTASAADLARKAPPPVVTKAPPPAYVPFTWTGAYVGINGGYGFGRSKWDGLPATFDVKGGLAGGQLGYNWQFGQFVWGLEGDGDWTQLRGQANAINCANTTQCQTRNDFLSTVRGRVGIAMDRWLPYATGGLAIGNIKATPPAFTGVTGIDKTDTGWTVGGGLEYSLAPNWSVKAEYLWVDLGKETCSIVCGLPSNNVNLTTNVVRGGINYHF
jgi:outer membrane immunogenic protein